MRTYSGFLPFMLLLLPAVVSAQTASQAGTIGSIPLPAGYERAPVAPGSFAAYLRNLPLRKDNTVYLYNGAPKQNQTLHYAVIDISTGKKDLQQCADLVMRLRAEYFYAKKNYDSIVFLDGNRRAYRFTAAVQACKTADRACLMAYLERVFAACGTYSLEQQLRKTSLAFMRIGDVLIRGGSPGHAEMIADMAVNKATGKQVFLLVESYMPAQDAHVLLNTEKPAWGPWHELEPDKPVRTATWHFEPSQLRTW